MELSEDTKRKERQAIELLKSVCKNELCELAYSGGKDSDVLLFLCKKAKIKFKACYKCTTIDPKGTIKHVKENGAIIKKKPLNFFELIKEKGMPTRKFRFCCDYYKEDKSTFSDFCIIGVRKAESYKRNKRYKEPTECRLYKDKRQQNIYPLLYWTDENIKEYIIFNNIKLHPLYYDINGNLNIKKRLGCIGCPLQSQRNRINEYKENKFVLKSTLKALQYFFDNSKNGKKIFASPYDKMLCELFYKSKKEFEYNNNFSLKFENEKDLKINSKKILEHIFDIKL